MKPERWEEIKRISAGIGNVGLLAGIVAELVAEIERLATEHATARNTIVNLLGENRALKAELRREATSKDDTAYGLKLAGEIDGEEQ